MGLQTIKFEFDSGAGAVTADDVVRALKDMLGSVGELSDWEVVRMSLASPFKVQARCSSEAAKPLAAFARNMRSVAQGKRPRGNLRAGAARVLDAVDSITKRTFGRVTIAVHGVKPIEVTRDSIDRARVLTGQLLPDPIFHRREQMGQLRGYLEQVTARRGQRPQFVVRDRITDAKVTCIIPSESPGLLEDAVASLKNQERVVVSGIIHYGEHSRPTSIKAALIEPIKEFIIPFAKLPKISLTADGNVVAAVRRLRDA